MTLLYGARTEADLVFRADFDAIAARCPKVKFVYVLSEEQKEGFELSLIHISRSPRSANLLGVSYRGHCVMGIEVRAYLAGVVLRPVSYTHLSPQRYTRPNTATMPRTVIAHLRGFFMDQ